MRNGLKISTRSYLEGFDSLKILNLEDNCIETWDEVWKLSQLKWYEKQ